MVIQLISGLYNITEATELLTAIFNARIRLHENRIRTIHETEEDIKHSEKRIIQLQENLRTSITKLRASANLHVSISAQAQVMVADK